MPALSELNPDHYRSRRWTLRAKLISLVVGVAALALTAVDVVLPLTIRSSMINDRDSTLSSVLKSLSGSAGGPISDSKLASLNASSNLGSEIGWTLVYPSGVAVVQHPSARDPNAKPNIPYPPPTVSPEPVYDASNPDVAYRAQALPALWRGQPGAYIVAWLPLSDVDQTVRQVLLLELLVTLGLLVLLGSTAGLIIRRELRPLEEIAGAADQIATGELDRRVGESDPDTEVGRLAIAFNGMLDGIQGLLAERSRGEEKLRQFIADAGHELRTPVAAVRGYSDLYGAGALPDDASVGRAMQRMGFEARRMGALVEDLLTLIQADSAEKRAQDTVNLADLLTGVVDDAAVIDPSRTWRLSGAGAPVTVTGDRMRLHQLFANLLANIRTHTRPGTVATISMLPGTDRVAVAVADNGPGVSDADLARLFDRFYRADPSRSRQNGGTGLGLSIVAAIVRGHGGEVLAAHTPGGGLTITVILPRAVGTGAVPRNDVAIGVVDAEVDRPHPQTSAAATAAPAGGHRHDT